MPTSTPQEERRTRKFSTDLDPFVGQKIEHQTVEALVDGPKVAKVLDVSPRTVEGWRLRKKIPYIVISPHCVRYRLSDVLASLNRFIVKEEK
jgi:hypothetical protein